MSCELLTSRYSKLGFILSFLVLLFTYSKPSQSKEIGQLPVAITNNAVAAAQNQQGWQLYSFNGLLTNKDWQSVSNKAFSFDLQTTKSQIVNNVPFKQGRLASIAVTVNNKIYLFGGYTVAADHQEVSMPDVYQFEPTTQSFSLFTKMPIPVDDTVALVYQNRYIYLISGWHDVGNVTDVQVLDTQTKKWFFATPYPGASVFGHAGGLVNDSMVIADGVKVSGVIDNKRQFAMSRQSYIGVINPKDFTQIAWKALPPHPGSAKYRMAATGSQSKQQIIFVGGSDNPYNYNGIGYNGKPSAPNASAFAWDLQSQQWLEYKPAELASMDHRGLIEIEEQFYIVGGMLDSQKVTNKIRLVEFKAL